MYSEFSSPDYLCFVNKSLLIKAVFANFVAFYQVLSSDFSERRLAPISPALFIHFSHLQNLLKNKNLLEKRLNKVKIHSSIL